MKFKGAMRGLVWASCCLLPITGMATETACASINSDSDGDGFGWENGATCLVNRTAVVTSTPDLTAEVTTLPACTSSLTDSNNDGYGWENNASCRVGVASIDSVLSPSSTGSSAICQSEDSDFDGDGFGWESNATCVVGSVINSTNIISPITELDNLLLAEEKVDLPTPACSDAKYDSDGDGYGWENSSSCTFKNAGDNGRSITDVIVVTGQSNALGAESGRLDPLVYVPNLDSPVKRVYAYSKSGWGIAGLQQLWDRDWYPRGDIANLPANNFAFHFGKTLVRHNSNAVVGIIMITQPGAGINHWASDGDFFAAINLKVQSALDALPGDPKVRGILWHQGETDYYSNDYYSDQLNKLIGDFRAQSWFAPDGVFICGETLNAPVNEKLMQLNSDADTRTGCVEAAGLASVGDDVHFDASSLRTLGARYFEKYQLLTR